MRLSSNMQQWLKERLSGMGKVYIFGSRANAEAKGGDIDILMLTPQKLSFRQRAEIRKDFIKKFGDQKLDLLNFTFEDNSAFKDLILCDAIEL